MLGAISCHVARRRASVTFRRQASGRHLRCLVLQLPRCYTSAASAGDLRKRPSTYSDVNGAWNKGTIKGNRLIGSNGKEMSLWAKTATTFSIMRNGKVYSAELRNDGDLHWSDGDVWTRMEAAAGAGFEAQVAGNASSANAEPEASEHVAPEVLGSKEDTQAATIPTTELKTLFRCAAIPMIGFGIMDNVIMIQAGDLIDNTLGVRLGLATLTAAACGQIVSDSCGAAFGGVVDAMVAKLGLKKPNLTVAQLETGQAKLVNTLGAVVGVIIGCSLGMVSLFFIDLDAAQREKEEQRKEELRDTVAQEVRKSIGSERSTLWVVHKDEGAEDMLVGKMLETGEIVKIPITVGIVGLAASSGKTWNVHDVRRITHGSFTPPTNVSSKVSGFTVRNNLAVPIKSPVSGKTLGVVQLLNKVGGANFSESDVLAVEEIASYLAYELAGDLPGFEQVLDVIAKRHQGESADE